MWFTDEKVLRDRVYLWRASDKRNAVHAAFELTSAALVPAL